MTGDEGFKSMDAGTSPEIGPMSNLPPQSFDWTNAMVSLLRLVLVGMFMATVTRMVVKAALGKPEGRPILYEPKGGKLLSQARPRLKQITAKERETGNLRQAIRDWAKQYKETPWLAEAKESFKLLKGRAKAIGLSDQEFEKLWVAEAEHLQTKLGIWDAVDREKLREYCEQTYGVPVKTEAANYFARLMDRRIHEFKLYLPLHLIDRRELTAEDMYRAASAYFGQLG